MPVHRWRAILSPLLLCAFALTSLSLLAFLAGCVRPTPTPEPVTIAFAYLDIGVGEAYRKWAQAFHERYPHITVQLQPMKGDSLDGTDIDKADAFVTTQFAMSGLQKENRILDLGPFVEQDKSFRADDLYPGTLALFGREGKTWAIPASADLMVVYYNQDLFDQRKVPYPKGDWTWNDFLNAAVALRDPDANVFGYAPRYGIFDPLSFIYQHGGRIFDDLANPTRTTFDDPRTIEALDWYVKLVFRYNVIPTPEQAQTLFGQGGMEAAINQGKVGMWSGMLSEQGGSYELSPWSMRWGMAPMPGDARRAALTLMDGYFISAKAQYPDACWKWIAFLSQQIPARQAPVRKSHVVSAEYRQHAGEGVAALVRDSMKGVLLLSPRLAEFEGIEGTFGQAWEAIMAQRATPAEAMTQAQRESRYK